METKKESVKDFLISTSETAQRLKCDGERSLKEIAALESIAQHSKTLLGHLKESPLSAFTRSATEADRQMTRVGKTIQHKETRL